MQEAPSRSISPKIKAAQGKKGRRYRRGDSSPDVRVLAVTGTSDMTSGDVRTSKERDCFSGEDLTRLLQSVDKTDNLHWPALGPWFSFGGGFGDNRGLCQNVNFKLKLVSCCS